MTKDKTRKKEEKFVSINQDKKFVLAAIILIIVLAIITINAGTILNNDGYDKKQCPFVVLGNKDANLKIKYFETPYCFYCWVEKPILEKLVKNKGNVFNIEKYDFRYCTEEASKYNIHGVPSFVFGIKNKINDSNDSNNQESNLKEYTTYGFIPEDKLNAIVCELTNSC